MNKNDLINAVIKQIKCDLNSGDLSVIDQLLNNCSIESLIAFLPEAKHEQFKELTETPLKISEKKAITNDQKEIVDPINAQELINFLEYEEAYTRDIESAARIKNLLKSMKIWNGVKLIIFF